MDGMEEFYDQGASGGSRSPSPNRRSTFDMGEALMLFQDDETTQDSTSSTSSESNNSHSSDDNSILNLDNENDQNLSGNDYYSCSDRSPVSSINDIPVNFPGYQSSNHSQILEAVIHTLQQSKNLLLECPSDAERRLAVLCGVLSYWQWAKQEINYETEELTQVVAPEIPSKIFYVTKSFTTINRVIKHLNEMGQTGQLEHLKMTVLGLRKNLCVHEDISKNNKDMETSCLRLIQNFNRNATHKLRNAQALPTCPFYSPQRSSSQFPFVQSNPRGASVVDIEDLMANGRQTNTCPYIDTTERLSDNVDLVICPQEYIMSSILQEDYSIDLKKAIVIFDDGYNVEKSCCEVEGSIVITSAELKEAAKTLISIAKSLNIIAEDEIRTNFRTLERSLSSLVEWMQDNVKEEPSQQEIRDALSMIFIPPMKGIGDKMRVYRYNLQEIVRRCTMSNFAVPDTLLLRKIRKFLTVLGYMYGSTNSHDYHVILKPIADSKKASLKLICANASLIFKPISDLVHSVILGSSCLAPICTIKTELGVEFHETLEIPHHVISRDRRFFGFCDKGPNNVAFSLSFSDRGNPKVQAEVGEAILRLCEVTPGGVLAFFHSKVLMHKIVNSWKKVPSSSHGVSIMNRLEKVKRVVNLCDSECNASVEITKLLNEFRHYNNENVGNHTGGLLLALHRSRVLDKMGFEDLHARLIIHVSIPYGPWYELNDYITAKREYFESIYGYDCVENLDWYTQEAFRILNQSFGRSVLNSIDWGAVVVLDNRMAGRRFEFENLLPAWVRLGRNSFKYCNKFQKLTQPLEELVKSVS